MIEASSNYFVTDASFDVLEEYWDCTLKPMGYSLKSFIWDLFDILRTIILVT